MSSSGSGTVVVDNALVRYGGQVRAALADLGSGPDPSNGSTGTARPGGTGAPVWLGPGFELPPPSAQLTGFLAASRLAFTSLGEYRGRRLTLLDLMRNPRTRTTKTFASLVIVARAVEHIQRTGEPVVIVSPSSGNKATALRDAVLRAYESGLVTAGQLSIVVVVPGASQAKLWASQLSRDDRLRAGNPIVTYDGAQRADVKTLAMSFMDAHAEAMYERFGRRLWYTLDIDNYKVADVVRACAEAEIMPPTTGRLHVHAVSSAFGLLGYNLGAERLASAAAGADAASGGPCARYFLVQHLDTPDMVLSLHFDSTSREHLPAYRLDEATGLYTQDVDPRFPATTFDPEENLDPTFYTRAPVTSAAMNQLIRARGGGGIVVSLHECLARYAWLRQWLRPAGVVLPADPRYLREWSLVMAFTGILNAIDRDLVPEGDDILVHGSGSYQTSDFEPVPKPHLTAVADVEGLALVTERALSGLASRR